MKIRLKVPIITKSASKPDTEEVRHILYIVCTSETPLSSTQIFKKMEQLFGYKTTRIYETIENLSPIWDLYTYSDHSNRYQYPRPTKYLNFISKEGTNQNAVKARKDFEVSIKGYEKMIKEYDDGKIGKDKLKLEKKNLMKKEEYYFRKFRRDYRYYPNLRTLLLYLYYEYSSRSTTRKIDRIHKVLSNPMVIRIAPFLEYWKDFEEYGFDIIHTFSNLLMEISQEFRNQLHIKTENDTYLLKRITDRIFSEIEIYLQFCLDPPGSSFFIKSIGIEKYQKLLQTRYQYRKAIIALKGTWIEEELKQITFYEKEQKELDFEKEVQDYIHNAIADDVPIINLEKVTQRYEKSTYDTVNLLLRQPYHSYYSSDRPYYYEYKNKRYLITISCLILESKTNDLKLLLIEGNNNGTISKYSQASSLLASNDIPIDSHSDLIKRLGFNFIRKNERGEYSSTDPKIIEKSAFKDFFNSVEYYPLTRQNFD